MEPIYLIIVGVVVLVMLAMAVINRYRRCPSDKILVVYGTIALNCQQIVGAVRMLQRQVDLKGRTTHLGVNRVSLFTQKFAQYMKVTPTEYRLNRQKNEQECRLHDIQKLRK